jgi:two-component system chemotaxis response regulator CheV
MNAPSSKRGATLSSASAIDPGILLEAGTNEVEILVFQVGSQLCGVNVAKVREARTLEQVTFLPRFPDAVDGVVRVRETVVPAVDLQKYLWGITESGSQGDERHLLLEFNDRQIAFRVQAIDRVHRVSWKDISPMPKGAGTDAPVTGIVLLGGKIVTLLDFELIGAKLGISGSTEVSDTLTTAPAAAIRYPLVFADDSALIRRMMEDALRQAGYEEIHVFSDGQEAWDYLDGIAAANSPDSVRSEVAGIITDVEMPRRDGFNLTKRIRENPVLKDLPVILFSSLVSKDNQKKGQQVGATAQVSKPKWDELSATLLDVLGQVIPA